VRKPLSPTFMLSRPGSSGQRPKVARNQTLTTEHINPVTRGQTLGKPATSSSSPSSSSSSLYWLSSSGDSRNGGSRNSNLTTAAPHRQPKNKASATDRSQATPGGPATVQSAEEHDLSVRISTAKSHLNILQVLDTYEEHDEDPSDMKQEIKRQKDTVYALEQRLREMKLKKKSPTKLGQIKDALRGYRNP
jgi:hypothetical protein